MSKPVCFYHKPDFDGHMSGTIVAKFVPGVELIPMDYGMDFPWDKVKDRDVHMVDFSMQPFSDMVRLAEEAKSLTWVDHHKTALDAFDEHVAENPEFELEGLRRIDSAACELCWEYYAGPTAETLPEVVYLLGRHDVWDLEADPNVEPLQYGLRMHDIEPNTDEGLALATEFLDGRDLKPEIESGKVILGYLEQEYASITGSAAFETELGGLKLIAINSVAKGSMQFDSVWDPKKYDAQMIFGYKDGAWHCSLYTTKEGIDVSAVAKENGGGGHAGASGFEWDELPDGFLK